MFLYAVLVALLGSFIVERIYSKWFKSNEVEYAVSNNDQDSSLLTAMAPIPDTTDKFISFMRTVIDTKDGLDNLIEARQQIRRRYKKASSAYKYKAELAELLNECDVAILEFLRHHLNKKPVADVVTGSGNGLDNMSSVKPKGMDWMHELKETHQNALAQQLEKMVKKQINNPWRSNMSTPKQRVEAELAELTERINSLRLMLSGVQPDKVSDVQWALLKKQIGPMLAYQDILTSRLYEWGA